MNPTAEALPFPAENASKKPSVDTRYQTRCARTAQMLFCHLFSLHSSASAHYFATVHSLFVALTFYKVRKMEK